MSPSTTILPAKLAPPENESLSERPPKYNIGYLEITKITLIGACSVAFTRNYAAEFILQAGKTTQFFDAVREAMGSMEQAMDDDDSAT